MKNKKYEHLFDYVLVVSGNFILACGIALFIIPNSILSGGLAGIGIALEPVFHINPQTFINVATICFFLVGSVFLGKQFAIKTAMSSFLYPFFLTVIGNFTKDIFITDNVLLASIYGGAFIGLGIGLVFRTGASTGGMDIPPLIIHKYTHIPLSTLMMITDALTVLLGASIHGIEPALIGIVSVWVASYMINKTISFGGQESKSVMIISDKYEEILEEIHVNINRGATMLEGYGSYSKDKKPVIMVAVGKKQYQELHKLVSHIDPNAFMIATDAQEVRGLGFTYENVL